MLRTLISHVQLQEFLLLCFITFDKSSSCATKCYVTIDVSLHITYTFLRSEASVFIKKNSPYFITSLVRLDLFSTENTQVSVISADNTEF